MTISRARNTEWSNHRKRHRQMAKNILHGMFASLFCFSIFCLTSGRYSIAYFCNPNFDKMIDVIPSTRGEGEKPKYEGVNSGEYLVRRLTATY